MKKIFLVLCLLSPVLAHAQSAGITSWSCTNLVPALSTNSPGTTKACSEFDTAGIQISCNSTSTADSTVIFRFSESLDSTLYESTPKWPLKITLNGTNFVTLVTNLNIPSVGVLKLSSIENTNPAAYVSNITVKVRFKADKVLTR